MTIRYNRTLAIILLILGLIDAAVILLLFMIGRLNPLTLGGLLTLFIGYSLLTRPYFTIEDRQIVLYALFGPLKRTYSFKADDEVKIEGRSLFVRKNGAWQRVSVARFLVSGADWAAMENRFKRA